MPDLAELLPCRRPELVVRPLGEDGPYVVKDPRTGAYYHLGDEEHFLLTQLNGQRDAETIRAAFAERFGQALSDEELEEFLDMAEERGLLQGERQGDKETGRQGDRGTRKQRDKETQGGAIAGAAPFSLRLLYWRKSFFDPDRLFTWLAPKIRFFWTPAFLMFSATCIVLAAGLVWANGAQLAGSFRDALRWETALWAWLVLLLITTLHEFAHGLTCKHYGGEVHEVGFLLLFFMPCFYCNVSDAWLFREKSKRLWVTFAGGYLELFLWALAVFAWRLTLPGTLPNHLTFLVLSVCGVQTLFNFNPLLKLDGYYLLSDWTEVPNLYQRSWEYLRGHARWMLWGAPRPQPEPRGRWLLLYGLVGWLYALAFLALSLIALQWLWGPSWGWLGVAGAAVLGFVSIRGIFYGFSTGEVTIMFRVRHLRTAFWGLGLGGLGAALFMVPVADRVSGPFQVRPAARAELRAPVAGFIQRVSVEEGDRVSPGAEVIRLEIPDLSSRLAQKRAEVRESQAKLRLLVRGPRPEEIAQQRRRVERGTAWRDLARQDLARAKRTLKEERTRLEKQVVKCRAELEYAEDVRERCQKLLTRHAVSTEECREVQKKCEICVAQKEQAEAEKRAREALGSQQAETELARRAKELADARATLALLEVGSRPEEIEAEQARLARLQEEARYLEGLQGKVQVVSPVAGVMTTPRLKEKVGQYVKEGDLIAVVEEPAILDVEITLPEQDVARVQVGQALTLKARALPFETFTAQVDRIAPAAGKGEVQSHVLVYCRLAEGSADLRPGMTGHARIATGQRAPGLILLDRALRYLRTEFWW
jgi:multidrug efflux pump subunit AcrA (membrane-fusion protein)